MKASLDSENHDSRRPGPSKAVQVGTVAGILLLALAARVYYAHGLPLNFDEQGHLRIAREISLRPGSFNLPLDTPTTHHPLGVVYLTALADWAGGGSVFAVRLAFILLSLIGLLGLFVLGASMFGWWPAVIALSLAAVDRNLVALAPVFLESPSVTFLAPWTILSMHKCLVRGLPRDWLLAGFLFGLGYWFSTLFLVMLLPFALYILASRRLGQVLRSPWMYVGVAVLGTMASPYLISDVFGGWENYDRNVGKLGSMGISPRMALLYAGDLLICLKEPTWIAQKFGGQMYSPIYIPCHWVMGLVYILAVVTSLRFWRDRRIALLLLVIVGFLIPVTLIDAREPWNEITWGNCTVFAAILLTALLIDRIFSALWSRVAASTLLVAFSAAALLWFLAGPKWGYFCPEWERAYVGQVVAADFQYAYTKNRTEKDRWLDQIRQLTDQAIARHPSSVMAWYYRGHYAKTTPRRNHAFDRALEIEPNNPLVVEAQAHDLKEARDWVGVKRLLLRVLDDERSSHKAYRMLGEAEYALGNYASAAGYARRYVADWPEDRQPYRALFAAYDAMGEQARAEDALEVYVARHPHGRAAAYLSIAEAFWKDDQPRKGQALLERAIRAGPRRPEDHALIGALLAGKMKQLDRGINYFEKAAQLGSTDPEVHFIVGVAMENKGEFAKAREYFEAALRLDPSFEDARGRLSALSTGKIRVNGQETDRQ